MAVNPRFIVNLKGKEFVMLGGLLELAHEQGIRSIETSLVLELCKPDEQRFVVQAIGRFRSGDNGDAVWSAYGDASPANSQMRGAELRHAETRAIARMLRWATNCPTTAFDELGPDSEDAPTTHHNAPQGRSGSTRKAEAAPAPVCSVCGEPVDDLIAGKALKRWRAVYCVQHGREKSQAEAQAAVDQSTGKEEHLV